MASAAVSSAVADATSAAPARPTDKFGLRRKQLAAAAQATLSEHGYARTSLREIAQRSEFSHGVFHYYFADKDELIAYCVTLYKEECATRYDEVVETSLTAEDLIAGFRRELVASLRDDGPMHRLWYDLRNQALFEPTFRSQVRSIDQLLEDMVWRVVERCADLADRTVAVGPGVIYAALDGLFQQALLAQAMGDDTAEAMADGAERLLRGILV